MQPGYDLDEVRLVSLMDNAMPDEEVNQGQRRVGLELAPRHGVLHRRQIPEIKLLDLVIPWLRHHRVGQRRRDLEVVVVQHIGHAEPRIKAPRRGLLVRPAAAARLRQVRDDAHGPHVPGHQVGGQRRLLVGLVHDALERRLVGLDAAGDGVVQHPRVRRQVAAAARHPEPVGGGGVVVAAAAPAAAAAVAARPRAGRGRRPRVDGHVGAAVGDAQQGRGGPLQLHERALALVVGRGHDAEVLAVGFAAEGLGEDVVGLGGLHEGAQGGVAGGGGVGAVRGVEEPDAAARLLRGVDLEVLGPGHLLYDAGGDVAVRAVIFREQEGVVAGLAAGEPRYLVVGETGKWLARRFVKEV